MRGEGGSSLEGRGSSSGGEGGSYLEGVGIFSRGGGGSSLEGGDLRKGGGVFFGGRFSPGGRGVITSSNQL